MNDTRARLKTCFAAAFPNLPAGGLEMARAGTTPEWDSVAMVTLISLVEEEFGMAIDLDDVISLNSFEAFERYVSGRGASA